MSKEDVSKLPRWAQERISIAERNLAEARKELSQMHGGESRVSFGYGENMSPKGYIPEDDHVSFNVGLPWREDERGDPTSWLSVRDYALAKAGAGKRACDE